MTIKTWTPATVCGHCVTLDTFRPESWRETLQTCDTCGDTQPGGRYDGRLLVTIRGTR